METKNFKKILKGLTPLKDDNENIIFQSISNMDIVFLTLKDESHEVRDFADPVDSIGDLRVSNHNYGNLKFRNTGDEPFLLPPQVTVLNNKQAQNHGMVKGAVVQSNSTKQFNDAGCVQGSQTGYIREEHDNEIRMLPFGVRYKLTEKVNNNGHYDNIYESITNVGRQTGANSGNYIDVYYKKHDSKLHTFINHFEYVDGAIGYIVLIDNEIVGIDKFPSYQYARKIFKMMVRDVYGQLALMADLKNENGYSLFTKNFSKLRSGNLVNRLKKALRKTKRAKTEMIVERISELMDYDFTVRKDDDSDSNYTSLMIKSEEIDGVGKPLYVGQLLQKPRANFNFLISIVRKEDFDPKSFREANIYKKMSKEQDDFSL